MLTEILLPKESQLCISAIDTADQTIIIFVKSMEPKGICPHCQTHSKRIHSCYQRKPVDLPIAGVEVELSLTVRRFFCDNLRCNRTTFTERMPAVVQPYARRTNRLAFQQRQVGFATSGEAGARLLADLGMPTSPSTLLRLIKDAPQPAFSTPRVLGVDDWAFRRGQSYGTILVDLEAHQPVDLLPDRTAETLENWLKTHPGVQIISRDRSKEYKKGATAGAPDAIQVADRWHLLKNIREAVQRLLETKPHCLKAAANAPVENPVPCPKHADAAVETSQTSELKEKQPQPSASGCNLTEAMKVKLARQAKREKRFAMIGDLKTQGFSIREISRQTQLHRQTVTRYFKAKTCPRYRDGVKRGSKLDPYKDDIRKLLQAGHSKATTICRHLKQKGYCGSYPLVARFVAKAKGSSQRMGRKTSPSQILPWSARRAAWLLFQPENEANALDKQTLERIQRADKTIVRAYSLTQRFVSMIKQRQPKVLVPWLSDVAQSGIEILVHFAKRLKR